MNNFHNKVTDFFVSRKEQYSTTKTRGWIDQNNVYNDSSEWFCCNFLLKIRVWYFSLPKKSEILNI